MQQFFLGSVIILLVWVFQAILPVAGFTHLYCFFSATLEWKKSCTLSGFYSFCADVMANISASSFCCRSCKYAFRTSGSQESGTWSRPSQHWRCQPLVSIFRSEVTMTPITYPISVPLYVVGCFHGVLKRADANLINSFCIMQYQARGINWSWN